MQSIQSPLPQFFDLDGSPLDAGFVYIGVANSNAETTPIPVFWDVGGTQPAAQPLRTVSGYVTRTGKAALAFVSTPSYSLTVRDRTGRLVYSTTKSESNDASKWITGVSGTNVISGTVDDLTSYSAGQEFLFLSAGANTGPVTLNINGLGAVAVTKFGAAPLTTGDIAANQIVSVVYDGTSFQVPMTPSRMYVNVRNEGATGNGTTDDTAAINAAAAKVPPGGVLYFPAGNYSVSSLTFAQSELTLMGDGYRSSWISRRNGSNQTLLTFGNGVAYLAGCSVVGLRLNGNKANNTAGSGIRFHSMEDSRVVGCQINNFDEDGIRFEGTGSRNGAYLRVFDNYIVDCDGHGIQCLNQAYGLVATQNIIAGCGKSPAGGNGVYTVGNDGHIITSNIIDECSNSVRVFNSSNCVVADNYLQNQDRHAVILDGGSTNNIVADNFIINPSTSPVNTYGGVIIDNSNANSVRGNTVWGKTVVVSDGVKEIGSANDNVITDNDFRGTITNPVTRIGSTSLARDNNGWPPTMAAQNLAAFGLFTFTHNFGRVPTEFDVWLVCTDAVANNTGVNQFAVGAVIPLPTAIDSPSFPVFVWADATTVRVRAPVGIAVLDPVAVNSTVTLNVNKWTVNCRVRT